MNEPDWAQKAAEEIHSQMTDMWSAGDVAEIIRARWLESKWGAVSEESELAQVRYYRGGENNLPVEGGSTPPVGKQPPIS